MTTALVSDLHIGTRLGADVARRPDVRRHLAEAFGEADHVVFLGDFIELREQPVDVVLEIARPILADLAGPLAGKRVTLVPGNHDHRLIESWLDRLRIEGAELGLELGAGHDFSPIATELARALPDSEVLLAYPGLRVREDVYAFHGHYLDLHMSVPRLESILGQMVARRMNGRERHFDSVADYERAVAPVYALSYNLAQGGDGGQAASRFADLSRRVWNRVQKSDGRGPNVGGMLLGRVAIPAGVATLNATGLGPFAAELTGEDLRRSGLRAITEVVENLGIDTEHVIFGHTHRHGPLPGEEDKPGWRTPSGIRLWNTGSWFLESVLVGENRRQSPYWPGGVIYVRDTGPPEPVNVLRELELQR